MGLRGNERTITLQKRSRLNKCVHLNVEKFFHPTTPKMHITGLQVKNKSRFSASARDTITVAPLQEN